MTWRPLSTAPDDGTEFLAADRDDTIDVVHWAAAPLVGAGWFNRHGEPCSPVAWQPLPDHPPLPEETP
jgi:hypothetical protein